MLDQAFAEGDLDEVNRLEAWLWLDGPGSAEGRVGGHARELALAMNAEVLAAGQAEDAGGSGVEAWRRLAMCARRPPSPGENATCRSRSNAARWRPRQCRAPGE